MTTGRVGVTIGAKIDPNFEQTLSEEMAKLICEIPSLSEEEIKNRINRRAKTLITFTVEPWRVQP